MVVGEEYIGNLDELKFFELRIRLVVSGLLLRPIASFGPHR